MDTSVRHIVEISVKKQTQTFLNAIYIVKCMAKIYRSQVLSIGTGPFAPVHTANRRILFLASFFSPLDFFMAERFFFPFVVCIPYASASAFITRVTVSQLLLGMQMKQEPFSVMAMGQYLQKYSCDFLYHS